MCESLVDPMSEVFSYALFGKEGNERFLLSLINGVRRNSRQTPIVDLVLKNPYRPKEFAVDKKMILDVLATDEYQRYYNLEVQVCDHEAFKDRMLAYDADLFSSQLQSGEGYGLLKQVNGIILSKFPIFQKIPKIHCSFQLRETDFPNTIFSEKLRIDVLKVFPLLQGKLELLDGIDRDLRHWFLFFAFADKKEEKEMAMITENSPIIQEAYEELKRFSANDEMREKIRERKFFIHDILSGLASAKEQGKIEGREEGRLQENIEIIHLLLQDKFGTIPPVVVDFLKSCSDSNALNSLILAVNRCNSIDDFVQKIDGISTHKPY